MRKVLAALITTGCFAAATALSASTANAQDAWNGGWHVGGDFYYPTDTSYSSAPVYGYGSAPIYNYASAPSYGYGSAPSYNYASAPRYGYGSAPSYNYASAPSYGYGSAPSYNYASAPIYDYGTAPAYGATLVEAPVPAPNYAYGSAPAYGPAVVGTPMPAPNYAYGSVPAYGSAVGAPVRTVEIVRTVYLPARSAARREIAMRRTARPAMAEPTSSRPLRDSAGSASVASNAQPLYDTAATAPAHAGSLYRYVYQRDRILVIDPSTGSVVQTLRR